MDSHVLDGLPSDVIFGEEFLEQVNAFNTCSEVMDSEYPYVHELNRLINLGPIQASSLGNGAQRKSICRSKAVAKLSRKGFIGEIKRVVCL